MPRYEYRCPANGRVVEISHGMSEHVATWGQLCERAGIEPGATAPETPVEKVVSLAFTRSGATRDGAGPCGPACGCHPH
ncbi:MAG: zinc ribbon domain-containing protein [Planctomycetota bacterium]|nr:MAG: zinc ribbon domain-containing protein [Planctomycetota bacterium]